MAEAVLGLDLILMLTQFSCKPAGGSRAVPWHQDGLFWPIEPLVSCSVWVAIDKVDDENGAMRVIPGSHHGNYRAHHLVEDPNLSLNREIDLTYEEERKAVTIELKPGQVSLHDIGLTHGSGANASPRRRSGLAIRYIPSTAHIHRKLPSAAADWTTMPVEVVRGVNRNAGNDFAVGDFGRGWD
jgi:ectoine hydroxylase-related dioxygenase (phytanoyl-CoA dioxygenase family)